MITQPTVAQTASHNLLWPDVKAWLAEHGLNADHVIEATIVIGRVDDGLGAWLDVTWYKLNANGNLYVDPQDPNEPAKGTSSIPLRSWPPLHPADG